MEDGLRMSSTEEKENARGICILMIVIFNTYQTHIMHQNLFFNPHSPKDMLFIDFKEKGTEREKQTLIEEESRLVASHRHPDWELNPQSKNMPSPGIKSATF